MSEESTFHSDENQSQDILKDDNGDSSENNRQNIFDTKFNALSDEFGEYCKKHNIEHAVILATDGQTRPMVFSNSDLLTTASLIAAVLKPMKTDIKAALDTD